MNVTTESESARERDAMNKREVLNYSGGSPNKRKLYDKRTPEDLAIPQSFTE